MNQHLGDDDDDQLDPQRKALMGLAVILALAILAIILVRALRTESLREDCLMAQRRNCAEIAVPSQR